MSDPWAFGWTQILTIIGLLITIGIAIGGFRTFGRWKREKLEERRIETALTTLALVYKARFVFDNIRSGIAFPYEWAQMPEFAGDDEHRRNQRGAFFAILKRIEAHKKFFEDAWELQAECTALFGPSVEESFLLFHRARREVEVSAEMLTRDPYPTNNTQDNRRTWDGFRADVWKDYGAGLHIEDKVGKKLSDFRENMEALCRPIVDRGYGRKQA